MKIRRVDFYPDDWLADAATRSSRVRRLHHDLRLIYATGGRTTRPF
jgi:hypothetical protein